MAGQLNKIHAAHSCRTMAPKIATNNRQSAAQQFSNRSPRCSDHENATTSVTSLPQSRPSVRIGAEGVIQGGGIMALHAEATLATRLVTHDKNACPQCQAWLLAPDWSEYLNERCVRHTWSCEACGYEFETAVFFSAAEAVAA
jgi:hypothetical protein